MGLKDALMGAVAGSPIGSFMDNKVRMEKIYGDGELKKASLKFKSLISGSSMELPVQFNPSEYSISHSVKVEEKEVVNPQSADNKPEVTQSCISTLSVTLLLDAATELNSPFLKGKTKQYLEKQEGVADLITELSLLTKAYHKTHTVGAVHFIWGSMDFCGFISSMNISYKMFSREGDPVRAEIAMTLEGDEVKISNIINSKPFESPDRTKVRMLQQRDELWMLAADEYDDPGMWREIAKANGILNPRKVDYTRGLKIPSI